MVSTNRNILLGTTITLVGSFAYVLMGVLSKLLGKHLLLNQIIFLQSVSGLFCAGYFIKIKKYHWRKLWEQHRPVYLLRIAMSLASIYTLIYGLQYVSIFNALVILNLTPFVIPLLRKLFFKKKINIFIAPAILLAFIGLILILSPDAHIIEFPTAIILISMFCMAFSLLILESRHDTDPNLSIFYYFLYSSLLINAVLLFQHKLQIPLTYVPLGVVTGILFFIVQASVIYAAKYISSLLISILFYAEIIMALFASVILEGLQLNHFLLLGIGCVIIGGIAVIWAEAIVS